MLRKYETNEDKGVRDLYLNCTPTIENRTRRLVLPFTQTLGQLIAQASRPEIEGSLGIYLKQNNGNENFTLTCRHCLFSRRGDYLLGEVEVNLDATLYNPVIEHLSSSVRIYGVLVYLPSQLEKKQLETSRKTQDLFNSQDRSNYRLTGYVCFSRVTTPMFFM